MNNYLDIISSLVLFTLVSILFLIILFITLRLILKKFDINNINVYGMFFNMKKSTIFAFSINTFIYLILIWLLIDLNINYIYIATIIVMSVISNLLEDDFPYGFLNILNSIISIVVICFISYFNNLVLDSNELILIVLKWIVVAFLFMYFTFVMLISLNHLLKTEKNRLINKRGNEDENK